MMSELGDMLREWARIVDETEPRGVEASRTAETEYICIRRNAPPEIRAHGHHYSLSFYVPRVPRPRPPAPCRCGLTSGHEPTCPEV